MEKVLFPQVYTNNLTGEVSFSGRGRDITEPDVYINPLTGARQNRPSSPEEMAASAGAMRKKLINEGFSAEGAEKFITGNYSDPTAVKRYGGRSGLMPVQPINFNDYFAF